MSVDCRAASSGYSPNQLISAFHNIPHVNIDLKQVSSEFSLSLEYFEPIIIWASIPILVCCCVFILLSVYFICICCCCCCCRDKQQRSRGPKLSCAFVISLLIIFCLGVIGATFYAEVTLDENIKSFLNEGQNVVDRIDSVTDLAKNYNSTSTDVDMAIDNIIKAINSSTGVNKTNALVAAQSIQLANENVSMSFGSINESLSNFEFGSIIDSINQHEVTRNWTLIGFMIAVGCILLLVCLVTICMSPVGIIIMLVVLMVCTLLVWLVTGVGLGGTILISDICYDPDSLIRNFTTIEPARDVVDYYISCEQNCNPFDQIINQTRDLFEEYERAHSVVSMYVRDNMLDVEDDIEVVESGITTARNMFNYFISNSTCSTSQGIHEYYRGALNYFCDQGQMFVLILFALISGLAVTFFLLICCLSCFAGLLINTSSELEYNNDDIVAFDSAQTTTWNSSNGRRLSYSEPYSNGGRREELMMSGLAQSPPKYSDLSSRDQRNSGEYDHFDV